MTSHVNRPTNADVGYVGHQGQSSIESAGKHIDGYQNIAPNTFGLEKFNSAPAGACKLFSLPPHQKAPHVSGGMKLEREAQTPKLRTQNCGVGVCTFLHR